LAPKWLRYASSVCCLAATVFRKSDCARALTGTSILVPRGSFPPYLLSTNALTSSWLLSTPGPSSVIHARPGYRVVVSVSGSHMACS
jgi:hypothetical protein